MVCNDAEIVKDVRMSTDRETLNWLLARGWMLMQGVSGNDKGLPFLMFGFVTAQTQNLMKISLLDKSTEDTRIGEETHVGQKSDGVHTTCFYYNPTGGMGEECLRYHSRRAEMIATKKGEVYSHTI